MIFRPKIFISSPFKNNEDIRKKIHDFFYSIGAEPLLYENQLTPSTIPMTYRENIKDADFVILIMKDDYGTRTDWNISGTHEEYIIARDNNIPMHVYLIKDFPKDNPLINVLEKDCASYYRFVDDEDLFIRLRETTFTIAREIMLSKVINNNLPRASIVKLSGNTDYNKAIEIIQTIESMKTCNKKYDLDWLDTNLFTVCIEPILMEFSFTKHSFLNWKLDELLMNMLSIAQDIINNHVCDYTTIARQSRECTVAVLGSISISRLGYYQNTGLTREDYKSKLNNFFNAYEEFKQCTQELRTIIDLA